MSMYENLSAAELRELAINARLLQSEMEEEDYTAIMDYELNSGSPDTKVIEFCFSGLKRFPKYNVEIDQPDFSTLAKPKFAVSHSISPDNPQIIDLKNPFFMLGGTRNSDKKTVESPYVKKLEHELLGKCVEKVTKNGKVFFIWTHADSYNITYLDRGMVGNIINSMSLETARSYISLAA